jgi:UDP-N-acetylmuramyl pentapeptide synthase
VVLLAGKGHEDYQEVAGVRRPFSDVAEAARAGAARGRRRGAAMSRMMTLAQAHACCPAARWSATAATPMLRVHSDTRTLQPGDLFVALRGERFDAHDFLAQARAAGAVAALAERGLAAGLPGLQVPDALAALQQLAAAWRARCTLPLIAVTGSNGKTTVTQMIAAILRAWLGDAALATEGNLNNHIGVPLTLLRLRAHAPRRRGRTGHEPPGRDRAAGALAAPTVALVNNAQREHQEFMAGLEAVARENGSVISAWADGTAVFPADDALCAAVARTGRRAPRAELCARRRGRRHRQAQWQGDHWALARTRRPLHAHHAGHRRPQHNLKNALAAAACALAAGAAGRRGAGLAAFEPVAGRSRCCSLRARPARSRWSTTATTPTPTRCSPPSTCWPPARPALAGAGRHGRGRRPGPAVPRRGGPPCRGARHRGTCGPPARCAARHAGGGRATSNRRRAAGRAAPGARPPRRCWSRDRAS